MLGLDPHIDITGLDIVPLLYSYLYSWKPPTYEAVFNNFAESVEMPSADRTEFIFKLRRGVMTHRGWDNSEQAQELTSEDVRASFIRRCTVITALDKRFPVAIAGSGISGTESPNVTELLTRLTTPERYGFSVTMRQPFAAAFPEMANPTWAIMPAKVLEFTCDVGPCFGRFDWGSGPFMIAESNSEERIFLKRHAQYFLAPRPWLDWVHYEIITDPEGLLEAFDSGEHDVCGAILSRAQAEERMRNDKLVSTKAPAHFYPVIAFNTHGTQPWSDTRVREAFDLALDRDEMIQSIWDGEGNYNGPVHWRQERFALPQEELRAAMTQDLPRAKQLLAAAGYANGLTAKMKIPNIPGAPYALNLASLIKQQVARVGIDLVLDEKEIGTFSANVLLPGNFEIAFVANFPAEEADRALSLYRSRRTQVFPGAYQDPQLDELIEAQESEFDEQKRIEMILKAQRLMLKEHGPQLTLPSGYSYGAHWKYVHNPYQPDLADGEDPGGPPGTEMWTEKA